MSILQKILEVKRTEVEGRKKRTLVNSLLQQLCQAPPIRPFGAKLKRKDDEPIRLIAELKKASPSKGVFRSDFDAQKILSAYEKSPASAISILTDEHFFQGSLGYLTIARELTTKPLLCKDFIIDAYQIYEARVHGADAVLLIVSALNDSELKDLCALARELGMDSLVEVHMEAELERALSVGSNIIGINNRNLQNFEVDLMTTLRLRRLIPENCVVVSESGIEVREQVKQLEDAGIDAVLVGETLIRSADPVEKAKELLGLRPIGLTVREPREDIEARFGKNKKDR
ncbi:MAG: indole-3-glycerol phosphate synthase TrpC [Candidatus Fervidibacter sp.]|uniref:indole-3-glycerol phosphate synthase TrpC n=1 Tax=Candidatus Fervidibacter sp. TaxID=3100871 RepID=UPI00404B3DC8